MPVIHQVGDNLINRIGSDVCQEYEILVLAVSHEDIGLAQGPSDVAAEFIDAVIELVVLDAVRRRERDQDLTCVDVVTDYVSDYIAVYG